VRAILSKKAVRAIHRAVEGLFNRAKARFLGKQYEPKRIVISAGPPPLVQHRQDLSLPGIFQVSSAMERIKPDLRVQGHLIQVAEGYLDAAKERAKADTVHAVQSFLSEAEQAGKPTDVETVLGGELADVFGRVTRGVKNIIETEGTRTRNASSLDAISKVSAMSGIKDPVVYFVVVNDDHICEECRRLHLLEDEITPRAWRLSEVGHQHHKRGDANPKAGGLHPLCRCTMVALMPGYGFKDGKVAYIEPGYDELATQRE